MPSRLDLRLLGFVLPLSLGVVLSAGRAQGQREAEAGPLHLERGRPPAAASAVLPGDLPYHNGPTLICADCHVMHPRSVPDGAPAAGAGASGDSTYALLAGDPVDVCLRCHDGRPGIPDVVGADVNGLQERSAGWFSAAGISNPHGHDLGRNLASLADGAGCRRCHPTPEGAGPRVTCIDCHDPHGNGNPRNLRWSSDPDGTPPLGLFNPPGMTGLARFERRNTSYGTANSAALREVSSLCLDCHHVFSGTVYTDSDGDGIHERHPSYDSERLDENSVLQGAMNGTTDPVHWDSGAGTGFFGGERVPFLTPGARDYEAARVVDAARNGVFCLSCHKAHGSGHAYSLLWDPEGPAERSGCEQCHAMSREPLSARLLPSPGAGGSGIR